MALCNVLWRRHKKLTFAMISSRGPVPATAQHPGTGPGVLSYRRDGSARRGNALSRRACTCGSNSLTSLVSAPRSSSSRGARNPCHARRPSGAMDQSGTPPASTPPPPIAVLILNLRRSARRPRRGSQSGPVTRNASPALGLLLAEQAARVAPFVGVAAPASVILAAGPGRGHLPPHSLCRHASQGARLLWRAA